MSKRKIGFFWASYADLMTSLFFVMLVLYILTFMLLQKQKESFKADAEQFRKIQRMEESVQELEKSGKFIYQKEYKRHVLMKDILFLKSSATIPDSSKTFLAQVGMEINDLINKNVSDLQQEDVKYLVIIEGMASKDKADDRYNYDLSYRRAYSLFDFWQNEAGIVFNKKNSEIIIAGSGIGGVGREPYEKDNQRFLIQIIPKMSVK